MKPTLKIDIVSDVVCPWCYIGKRRLETAMSELADQYNFDIHFLPFELNPDMPPEGRNQKEYLVEKFGGEERYEQLTSNVSGIAAQEGLKFNYDLQTTSPNTHQAHRVLWKAAQDGKQGVVKEAFMKAYFTEGVDLSKKENLVNVAVSAGLDREKISSFLDSDEGSAEVIASQHQSAQRGVRGVPFFVINDKFGISGAQTPDVLVRALNEIATQEVNA